MPDRIQRIADSILYEGYVLYPYRASSIKNRQRFNFGILSPQVAATPGDTGRHRRDGGRQTVPGSKESRDAAASAGFQAQVAAGAQSWMQAECLVEGARPVVNIRCRALQPVQRQVFQERPGERPVEVDSLSAGGRVYQSWIEAIERECRLADLSLADLCRQPVARAFLFERSQTQESIYDETGQGVGQMVRCSSRVEGAVDVSATELEDGLWRLQVAIQNTTVPEAAPAAGGDRTPDDPILMSLVSTHCILTVAEGDFHSLLAPPDGVGESTAACRNVGLWPVLAGTPGARSTLLASPIILYDYPQIADESAGDFFDGTEIDEMLAIRVRTLTPQEQHAMQSLDPLTAQILERTTALTDRQLSAMHGVLHRRPPLRGEVPADE